MCIPEAVQCVDAYFWQKKKAAQFYVVLCILDFTDSMYGMCKKPNPRTAD
jgi:hypothetical protein